MDVGDVFQWVKFPDQKLKGEIKTRWFICIGKSIVTVPRSTNKNTTLLLMTTTTQLQHYQTGGSRAKNIHHSFSQKDGIFEQDCILDCDMEIYYKTDLQIDKASEEGRIVMKGKLDEIKLKLIYSKLFRSSSISPIILKDIYKSLLDIGIIDIKKP